MEKIKRFNLDVTPDGQTGMFHHPNGHWVTHSDHVKVLEGLIEDIKSTIGEVCDDSFYSQGYDHAVDVMTKLIQSKLEGK